MLEAGVLSGVGGVLGVATSFIMAWLLRTYTSYQPIITWQPVVIATLVSIAVGIIFGTAPAIKAARKDPIEALRHE
jgi:putative ABC transport system permease protein